MAVYRVDVLIEDAEPVFKCTKNETHIHTYSSVGFG